MSVLFTVLQFVFGPVYFEGPSETQRKVYVSFKSYWIFKCSFHAHYGISLAYGMSIGIGTCHSRRKSVKKSKMISIPSCLLSVIF